MAQKWNSHGKSCESASNSCCAELSGTILAKWVALTIDDVF